jgi:hypothetical protein
MNAGTENVSIHAVLLAIGYLTTPSHASGVSLSEFWAWVRYLYAVSPSADLRLTRSFFELDSHQKTILSDDFGIGVPMYWLTSRLDLGPMCDGRYFIERMASSVDAVAQKTAKRGPSKSPDFVAQDLNGTWHVIECKGTQSGTSYRDRQLTDAGPPPTGAVIQKRTITFPAGVAGQKLACGLTIGIESGKEPSHLRIIDPTAEGVEVSQRELASSRDAVVRATAARCLRLAGFESVSQALSAPSGRTPSSRRTRGQAERARQEFVNAKRTRASEELSARGQRKLFTADHERFRGREVQLDLPITIAIGDRAISSVRIRQGVNAEALGELAHNPLTEELLEEADTPWREAIGKTEIASDPLSARFRIGKFFVSEIDLRR